MRESVGNNGPQKVLTSKPDPSGIWGKVTGGQTLNRFATQNRGDVDWNKVAHDADRVQLTEARAVSRALMNVYVFLQELQDLRGECQAGNTRRFRICWYRRRPRRRIAPLNVFARRLRSCLLGLLAHYCYPLPISVIEGIASKNKVVKRMSYSFRRDKSLFLKSAPRSTELSEGEKRRVARMQDVRWMAIA